MALLQLTVVVVGFVLYRAVTSFVEGRRFKTFAKQNNCQPAHNVSGSFLTGFKRLKRILDSKKTGEDILDDIILADLKESPTIQFSAFDGTVTCLTADPANLQAMLATQFKDFELGSRRYNVLSPLIGRSIFTSDGAFWEHSRALFRPHFSRENINDLEMTDRAASEVIEAIGETDTKGWSAAVDMLPILYNFTLDTATDFLFGQSVESQRVAMAAKSTQETSVKAQSDEAQAFTKAFAVVSDALVMRIRMQSLYWLGDSFEIRRAIKTIKNFVAPIVQRAIDTAASSAKRDEKKQTLLTSLATQTQDEHELRNQTLAILLAGRDTTSALLCWALLRLALHPEIFTKLRNVVLQEFPVGEENTFAKLKGCRYLQHFLNEVLRLHPTVPMNQRMVAKDTTFPKGGGTDHQAPIALRKGQSILFSVYAMHRRKDLWGPDALEFKPERWEQRIPPWHFLPFLGGPRICVGQLFAITEASFLIVRLLQEFDAITPVDPVEMQKMRKGLGLTMWPRDGTKVFFHSAAATSDG